MANITAFRNMKGIHSSRYMPYTVQNIRPILEYAISVWNLHPAKQKKKNNAVFHKYATRLIPELGVMGYKEKLK